jgi:LCP family protein required for cell wall assembly
VHILGKVFVGGLATVVFGATAYGYSTITSLNDGLARTDVIGSGAQDRGPGEQALDGAVDILLVGRDSRKDEQGNPLPAQVLQELRAGPNGDDLTDTLIVLRIPNGQDSVKAFSIPRDSYVDLPEGLGKGKINAAFGLGKLAEAAKLRKQGIKDKAEIERESLTAGRTATREAVENLTGLTIDHYAEVNLLSFYDISQAVGGVNVNICKATKDEASGADFAAGPQLIEGANALAFVRQRDNLPGTDLGRVRRQQVFLASLAKSVLSAGTLANPGKLGDLIDSVKKSVVLDDNWDLLDFVQQMQGLSDGNIAFKTIPVGNVDYRYSATNHDLTAVQVDPAQVKAFVGGLLGGAALPPSAPPVAGTPVTVDVYNAGEKEGLAARVASLLKTQGYTPGKADNSPDKRRTSLVEFGAGMAAQGSDVAKALGGLNTRLSADVPAGHIVVQLGQVYSGPGATDGGAATGATAGTSVTGIPGAPKPSDPVTAADSGACVD